MQIQDQHPENSQLNVSPDPATPENVLSPVKTWGVHRAPRQRHGHHINRPEVRNAVNGAVSTAVGDALAQAQHDAEVRAVVITGAGNKSFCAGADLKAIARGENLFHLDHGEWEGSLAFAEKRPPVWKVR